MSYKIMLKDYTRNSDNMNQKDKLVKLSDDLSEHRINLIPYLNGCQIMFPEVRLFNFSEDSKILFYQHIHTRNYFNLEPDFSEFKKIIELSKDFNDEIVQSKKKIIFQKFNEEVKNIDKAKFIKLIEEYNNLRNDDKNRVRSDITFLCDKIIGLNLPKYNKPIFFNASIVDNFNPNYTELSIDIYKDYFQLGSHAFFVCYYPKNNTFYVIDPDENGHTDKIIEVIMKFFCKGLDYKPNYRIVKGIKVQELIEDQYCTIHSLDMMRQISENPSILELNDDKLCEYFLKDYLINDELDENTLYDSYIKRYYK